MLESLKLRHVGPAPALGFRFAPRLNLITGDNGLGKSFVLDTAWWALTRSWPAQPATPWRTPGSTPLIEAEIAGRTGSATLSSRYDADNLRWPVKPGRPATPGIVLYARVDGISVWDPARNYWAKEETKLPPAYHLSSAELWDGLRDGERVLCNGIIADWRTWQLQNGAAFRQLTLALQALSPDPTEPIRPGADFVRLSIDDVRDIPTVQMPYGDVPIVHASAGMKRILSLAYALVWALHEHQKAAPLRGMPPASRITMLVDEADAHLHPRWQRRILPALLSVVGAIAEQEPLQLQLIATTHAPLLLASAEPLFDDAQDALWTLDYDDQRTIVSERASFGPRGDAAAWLTSEVFDLETARSIEAEQAIARASAALHADASDPDELRDISTALRRVLADTDPFWVRWLFLLQKRGVLP